MKFDLKAEFELSKSLPAKAKAQLKQLLKEADTTLFKRGCPKGKEAEAGHLKSFKLSGRKLQLHITSGRYVRAHACASRLKNLLAKNLGKDFHIGLKSLKTISYSITLPAKKKADLSLAFVKKLEWKKKEAILHLEELDLEEYEALIDKLVSLFHEKTSEKPQAKEHQREVWYTGEKPMATTENISETLERKGWVKHFAAGIFHYMPPYTKLMRYIENLMLEEVAKPLGFEEIVLPKLIPLEVMRKKGQLTGIPEEMFYVSEPGKRDLKHFEKYTDYVKLTGDVSPEKLQTFLRPPRYALPYAQCEPFYEIFSNKITDIDKFPFKFFDRSGFSFRYEAGGKSGMERLNAFTRIELAYIGTPKQVKELRDSVVEKLKQVLSSKLGIECRLVETTPVWLAHSDPNAEVQKTDVIGTYDIEAYIPNRGGRKESEWLEICNASVSFDKYHARYSIKERARREAWTGCSGIGLERVVYAFLSQKGFDMKNWPAEVKQALGQLPAPPKMLDWPKET